MTTLRPYSRTTGSIRMTNPINYPKLRVALALALVGLLSGATLALEPAGPASGQVVDPSWSNTDNLNTGRSYHTATLLQNGKVLVVGGLSLCCPGIFLNSAELYDPVRGTWHRTANLNAHRCYHTATLLPNGEVLVVGGTSEPLSAELYDPETGTWRITGTFHSFGWNHTATLLPNGKVLVAGGRFSNPPNIAELYDPATGTWSSTSSLNTHRAFYTATLLPDGEVLVAGGFDASGSVALNSVELYDPDTGMWRSTGNLITPRGIHTATLLQEGKVLIAGGSDCEDALFFKAFTSGEVYDPVTGTWSSTGNLNTSRAIHTATPLPSGKVLVAGGLTFDFDFDGTRLDSAELFDPATGTWSSAGDLNRGRFGHTATLLLDGRVLVAGGFNSLEDAELYALTAIPCSDSLSPTSQFFDSGGGTGSVDVTAGSECNWTAISQASWISIASGSSSGNGTVTYSVAANSATSPREGTLIVAARAFTVTQAGLQVKITSASVTGKKLFVFGENFDDGAVILLNGEEQRTLNDSQNPKTTLIGKKAGKKVKPGDKLQVRNPNGTQSEEFSFTGM